MPSGMKSRPLSDIRAERAEAALKSDLTRLERLLFEGAEHPRGQEECLLPLARLHEERGQKDEAAPLWRRLFTLAPSLEGAFHLLRLGGEDASAAGDWLDQTVPGAAEALDDLIRHPPPCPSRPWRHVAICGVSYCGSTVLGRLLDGLEGVHDIGESHWLIEQRSVVNGSRLIDFFAAAPSPTTPYCRQCGEACNVLNKTFRLGLQVDRRHWYRRIAAQVETAILVSSDKNLRKYCDLDPELGFDAIVLFKSPVDAWHSFRKRLTTDKPDEQQAALDAFIASWSRQYGSALRLLPKGRKLFLHFERLAKAPAGTLARLAEELGLPTQRTAGDGLFADKHAIGGNDGFFVQHPPTDQTVVRQIETPAVPDEHRRRIADDVTVRQIQDAMLSQSQAVFGRS